MGTTRTGPASCLFGNGKGGMMACYFDAISDGGFKYNMSILDLTNDSIMNTIPANFVPDINDMAISGNCLVFKNNVDHAFTTKSTIFLATLQNGGAQDLGIVGHHVDIDNNRIVYVDTDSSTDGDAHRNQGLIKVHDIQAGTDYTISNQLGENPRISGNYVVFNHTEPLTDLDAYQDPAPYSLQVVDISDISNPITTKILDGQLSGSQFPQWFIGSMSDEAYAVVENFGISGDYIAYVDPATWLVNLYSIPNKTSSYVIGYDADNLQALEPRNFSGVQISGRYVLTYGADTSYAHFQEPMLCKF